jgi:pimeloyl-CoA synthetase
MKYYRILTYSPVNGKYASSKVIAISDTADINDYIETCERADIITAAEYEEQYRHDNTF